MRTLFLTLASVGLMSGVSYAISPADLSDGKSIVNPENIQIVNGFPLQLNNSFASQPLEMISGNIPYTSFETNIPDGEANYYAFQFDATGSLYYRGVLHSLTSEPWRRDFLAEWPNYGTWNNGEYIIDSGCMVGDEYWAYISTSEIFGLSQKPVGIYRIDLKTGLMTDCLYDHSWADGIHGPIEDYQPNWILQEMSYDPKTNYVYGVQRMATGWAGIDNLGTMNVVRIDPDNPQAGWEEVGLIKFVYTMACDNGYMYFLQQEPEAYKDENGETAYRNGYIHAYRINLEDYGYFTWSDLEDLGRINNGFLKMEYGQTMEFDHTTHKLWWAGITDGGETFLTTIDLETLETEEELRQRPTSSQWFAMAIPYEVVEDEAPSYMKNVTFKTADEGVESVDFTWTTPNTNYQLEALSALDGVRIYRDGELLEDITPVEMNAAMTYTDNTVASGNHFYTFVGYNEHGEGLTKQREMFIGRDVPGAVNGITLKANGNKATLSWNAAQRGKYNGWYDHESLKFNVIRYPDCVTVAEGITETSINEEVEAYEGYYYEIIPINAEGEGVHAYSTVEPFGNPLTVPYKNDVPDIESARRLKIFDYNHDGVTWSYGRSLSDGHPAMNYTSSENPANDYFVLPELILDPNKKYEMRFRYASSNIEDQIETIQVCQGTTQNPSTHVALGEIKSLPWYSTYYQNGSIYINDGGAGNFLSIKAATESSVGWIAIRDIVVREYSATDLSVMDFNCSEYAYIANDNAYRLTVRNEGYAATDKGVAQIVNAADGTVLAEAPVGNIEKGETKDVIVKWVPTVGGNYTIIARVVLEGDTYPDDNRYADTVDIQVMEGTSSMWIDVLKRIQTGWRPIYSLSGYSDVETIYLESEIGLSDIYITGLAYIYEPAETGNAGMRNIPVRVLLGTTNDKLVFEGEFYPEDTYTEVFNGKVDLRGTHSKNDCTMMFDKEYYYPSAKNLIVRCITECEKSTPDNVNWWIHDEQSNWTDYVLNGINKFRSRWSSKSGNPPGFNDQVPVMKLAYRTGAGIEGVITASANFNVVDGEIVFDEAQTSINVYDMAGKHVAEVNNATRVSGLSKGIYTVTARKGNDIANGKVIIK